MKKNELKTKLVAWWNTHKGEVEVGAYCFGIGLCIGIVKGILVQSGTLEEAISILTDMQPAPVQTDDMDLDTIKDIVSGLPTDDLVELTEVIRDKGVTTF